MEMNLRFYIICVATSLILLASASITLGVPFLEDLEDKNVTATVHGATYAQDTLEPLNDTLIDVNSTPPQSMVAKDGVYSFELVPGEYAITARYYRNNTLIYSKEATFKIEGEGNYVFDLLLYPNSKYPVTESISTGIKNPNSATRPEKSSPSIISSIPISSLPVTFVLLLLLGGGYKFSRKHKNMDKNGFKKGKNDVSGLRVNVSGKNTDSGERPGNPEGADPVTEPVIEPGETSEIEALKRLPLSTELCEVLDIIRGHKGRITQKDLRSKLEYSEVKVSLMLTELEKRGLIQKLRNGRENIVVLIDQDR